jgi:hypothetical protein
MTITLPLAPVAEPDVKANDDTTSLLKVVRDALVTCAELDPDMLHSSTPAGEAVIHLARLARSAVAALGGDPGTTLYEGPGVVVIRDLVHAVMLLELAAAGSPEGVNGPDLGGFGAAAGAAHASLQETIRSALELA